MALDTARESVPDGHYYGQRFLALILAGAVPDSKYHSYDAPFVPGSIAIVFSLGYKLALRSNIHLPFAEAEHCSALHVLSASLRESCSHTS